MEVRLNKYISDSGFCSRREADRFIEKGKVTINRRVASLGDMVQSGDIVKVNGTPIEVQNNDVYIALNKPVGISSTTDNSDKTNVINFMKFPQRIFHIGRLDKDSEGLLLLTNNGDIVNKILREGNNHEKEYEVWVDKPIDNRFVEKMSGGVKILGTVTKRCKVELEGATKFRITLTQGLNRQIRRMCEEFGVGVVRLRRVRIMNIKLGNMHEGEWRILEGEELTELFASLKDSDNTQKVSTGAGSRRKPIRKGPISSERRFGSKTGAKSGNKPHFKGTDKSTDNREKSDKTLNKSNIKGAKGKPNPRRGEVRSKSKINGSKPKSHINGDTRQGFKAKKQR